MFQSNRLVKIVFGPGLFRLGRWVEFLSGSSRPPPLSFLTSPTRFIFTRSRNVKLSLRLHRWSANTKVPRKLCHCRKLCRRFQVVPGISILTRQSEVSFAVKTQRRIFTLTRGERSLAE